jgi:phosphatidylserine/phosphatidylglycerophosphate/cardiolipin synthase-like enzyme
VPVARALGRGPRVAPEAVWTGLHRYACEPAHVVPEFREGVAGEPERLAARARTGQLRWVDDVRYVSDAPGKNAERSSLSGGGLSTSALIALVRAAKRDVTIQTPYLVTTALGQGLFAETVARGVRVRILTNSLAATDNVPAFAGYRKGRAALLAGGVELYEYRPDATIKQRLLSSPRRVRRHASFGLHAKSMVIDGETLVVGTFNLDPRSANLNTEGIAVLRSPELARGVQDLIEREMAPENAWRATPADSPDDEAPVGRRIGAWAAGLVPASLL